MTRTGDDAEELREREEEVEELGKEEEKQRLGEVTKDAHLSVTITPYTHLAARRARLRGQLVDLHLLLETLLLQLADLCLLLTDSLRRYGQRLLFLQQAIALLEEVVARLLQVLVHLVGVHHLLLEVANELV